MVTVEDAIHDELITASGLAGARIIYEHQNRPALEPAASVRELMTVRYDNLNAVGGATPSQTQRDNPASAPGEEILIGTLADVRFSVRVMFYAGPTSGTGSAYERLRGVIAKLGLDSVALRLQAVNVSFIEARDVRSVPVVLETEYESRAVADLFFSMTEAAETPETYIETIDVTGTYT